tara:strand:- start:25338 stop:26546 length:1209 start_codon:yes stop_codon:yes gene_type:complete
MKKLTELLKEFKSQAYFNGNMKIGQVYSNPYARSFVNEKGEEMQRESELNIEQKQAFLEAVKSYKRYSESIYRNRDLKEVYQSIKNVVEVAQKMTIDETQDWFDGVTVGRHMKRMNESFKVFEKTLKEVSTLQQRLESAYDEIGEVLGKYYEINELEEGNEFGAARAKAIAAGEDSFEVDGKTYKVTGVDKEDKENAKKFVGESVNESTKLTDILKKRIKSVNEAEIKVTNMDKVRAREITKKYALRGGYKIPYKVAKRVVGGHGDLSKVKRTLIHGYGLSEDDFLELANLKPGVHKHIYDLFQQKMNESVNEAKDTYFDSATEAVNYARKMIEKRGFEIDEDDWQSQIGLGGRHGRIRPGTEKNTDATIGLLKNGKPQRKALQISLYGMPSGKYELTYYVN